MNNKEIKMKLICNMTEMQEFIQQIPYIITQLNETQVSMTNYISFMNEKSFFHTPKETFDEKIKIYESILDKLNEVVKRRNEVSLKSQELLNNLKQTFATVANIVENGIDFEKTLDETHDEIIYKIIELRKQESEEKIKLLMEEIQKIKTDFRKREEELKNDIRNKRDNQKEEIKEEQINTNQFQQQKQTKQMIDLRFHLDNLENIEMKKLEQWTGKKCNEVIFDSNKDNWSENSSVFDDRILNKRNLIFLIEDARNNKFGGYINETITSINSYTKDSNAFVFSLKSNGRINGMYKFEITNSSKAFYLNQKESETLFSFGDGFDICSKKNKVRGSYCNQSSYNYGTAKQVLCGYDFTPKRITVIQMK